MIYRAHIINDGVQTVLLDRHHSISDAKITEQVNAIDTLKFVVYPGQECEGLLFPFTTSVRVIDVSRSAIAFDGRILDCIPSMDASGMVCWDIMCESSEGYLKDSRQPYIEERLWNSVQECIDAILANHNARVESHKRVLPGEIADSIHGVDGGFSLGCDRESTYDALFKGLIGQLGGEMRLRRGPNDLLMLDYKERLGRIRDTPIELGRNMRSASRSMSFDGVVTRLIPLGKKMESSDDRLTIASVNSGKDYIEDASLIASYGVIEGVEIWDKEESPSVLLAKGTEYLKSKARIPDAVKIDALDLSLIGLDKDDISLHDWYPCRNHLIRLDETLEVVKRIVDINEPSKTSYEFGAISLSLTNEIRQSKVAAKEAADKAAASGRVSPISIDWLKSNVFLGAGGISNGT